ncbi:MAG: type II toxin-antitoxin system YafQ family toxin [Ignavibacteriae bacterium]|nr:type II toxin-antitoxin system YafQ family toxin [Ignavibacteriota bacterium]
MKRTLLKTNAFIKSAKDFISSHPEKGEIINNTLNSLSENLHEPKLKTHKLKGNLSGLYACSAGYDVRVIFEIIRDSNTGVESILLEAIGTHEEVY